MIQRESTNENIKSYRLPARSAVFTT